MIMNESLAVRIAVKFHAFRHKAFLANGKSLSSTQNNDASLSRTLRAGPLRRFAARDDAADAVSSTLS